QGLHDLGLVGAARYAVDESLVYFQVGNGQRLQVIEGGISFPEIVKRYAEARISYTFQDARRMLEVLHREALGYLKLEPFRPYAGFFDYVHDLLEYVLLLELSCRQVHGYLQVFM